MSTWAIAWTKKHPRLHRIAKRANEVRMRARIPRRPPPAFIGLDYGVFLAEKLAEQLPLDVDCVIGIPRSGLLFASVIATKRALPLSTPDDFVRGTIWQTIHKPAPTAFKKVLLIDDATGQGEQMDDAVRALKAHDPQLQVHTASLLVPLWGRGKVDQFQAVVEGNAIYEWNIAHAVLDDGRYWGGICVDMDGVLCMSEHPEIPYLIPNFTLDGIITSRPAAEREATEAWLLKHGVKYKRLLMRETGISSVEHKVYWLKQLRPWWFWESYAGEAGPISKQAHIPVLCIEDMRVYNGRELRR